MTAAPAPFEAIVFDLDGVLVDSEIWWDDARRDFAAARGRTWTMDDRHAVMGANSRQWSGTIRERLHLEVPDAEIERAVVDAVVARYRAEGAPVIDGAVEAARQLAAILPAALASSAHHDVIDAALAATGLEGIFREVVSSDDVAHGKPAPDVYLEAARRLGADPALCLVVEDSLGGVRAAKAAGMTVVLIPNDSIPPPDEARALADVVIDRLADLDLSSVRPAGDWPAATAGPNAPVGGVAPVAPIAAVPVGTTPRRGGTNPEARLPGAKLPRWRRTLRYYLSRLAVMAVTRAIVRIRVEGRDRLPDGPAVYCFNHMNWTDPFMLMASLPLRPWLYFFGPKEEDMAVGGRNRLMSWTGSAVPYKPGKNDLLEATRRVRAVFDVGGVLAIAGEERIHVRESELLPLNEGAAFFAIRSGLPLVPIAISGTSWLEFGRRVRVRIGEPIAAAGRPTHDAVAALTDEAWQRLHDLVADAPDMPLPGRFGRWLTDLFNDWPGGSREQAAVEA